MLMYGVYNAEMLRPGETLLRAIVILTCKSISNLGMGVKDYSNHLVDGSLQSFPWESWCSLAILSGELND